MISEQTEEEMLDLAMRLSAQEASLTVAAQKRQQEDNNIQKAIADSLDVGETFVLIKAVMHYMTLKLEQILNNKHRSLL